MSNLYILSGQDDEIHESSGVPEFIKNDDGTYNVVVRFRNKEDLHNFSDIIYQPKLKRMSNSNVINTSWPEIEEENDLELLLSL